MQAIFSGQQMEALGFSWDYLNFSSGDPRFLNEKSVNRNSYSKHPPQFFFFFFFLKYLIY
jgi:hypothetical protein